MNETPGTYGNEKIRVRIGRTTLHDRPAFWIEAIELFDGNEWMPHLLGIRGHTFWTSLGNCDAVEFQAVWPSDSRCEVVLKGGTSDFAASVTLAIEDDGSSVELRHKYRFARAGNVSVNPGFRIPFSSSVRYTFPLRAHEQSLSHLRPIRSDIEWALPFPFHVWHDGKVCGWYGVDRARSAGTLDVFPDDDHGLIVRTYWPDVAPQSARMDEPSFCVPQVPHERWVGAGEEVEIIEVVGGKCVASGEVLLLEATRSVAPRLLTPRSQPPQFTHAAARIADFFRRCELWDPAAFDESSGWFRSMWTFIEGGVPRKDWPHSTFDLGWGEGIAVEAWVGFIRHARRTGSRDLLNYVEEMTRSIHRFKRAPGAAQPFFDRYDRELNRFGDFMMSHGISDGPSRIWIHSLAHTGNQLLTCYESSGDLVSESARLAWRDAFTSIAEYLARVQRPNGDLPDIVGCDDSELNFKPHRISARLAACGLWSGLARITGDESMLRRAMALSRAAGPEIDRFEYYNQMLDGICAPDTEFQDGEAAYYVLEGLVPLLEQTGDPYVLSLCRKAAAFGIAWTYFFDVPNAPGGMARGGQCCRMPDFPLLYPIGPAKGIEPLLRLSKATDDGFLAQMAGEMASFLAGCLRDCPGQPWDGSVHHAIHQPTGKGWGPDLKGQADTGMSSGNALAALEYWIAHSEAYGVIQLEQRHRAEHEQES